MKRTTPLLLAGFSCLLGAQIVRADDISNNIAANLEQKTLNAFAKDVGAVMGGGSFHQGKALGFPIGVDVGVHVPVVGVQADNKILKDDRAAFGAVWGQAELGLPGKIDLIARGGKMFDAKMIGGGIRVGILSPSVPGVPAISIMGLYDKLTHDYFEAKTISANLVASLDLPFIRPYIGAGYDHTELDPTEKAFNAASNTVSRDLKAKVNGYRAEVGVNLSVIPFTYVTLGAGLANGQKMFHAGLGVKI